MYIHNAGPGPLKRSKPFGTAEAAKRLEVSKNTLLRWFRSGAIGEVGRDHRGWRVFTDGDVETIRRTVYGDARSN